MLKRICQICGSGYNNNRVKCLECGNIKLAKVRTSRVGTGLREFTFSVEHDGQTEKLLKEREADRKIDADFRKMLDEQNFGSTHRNPSIYTRVKNMFRC